MSDKDVSEASAGYQSPQPILVIMAAGLGSRFGGVKQLARVGQNNEAILDFSIIDGLSAGFGKIVLIVRSEIEADVKVQVAAQHPDLAVSYVCQDALGPPRDKPWGTLHAVLSAADEIDAPFAVINADDYYGPASFELAVAQLVDSEPGRAANVAFEIGNTVPSRGAVTRALCEVADCKLTAIVETDGCEKLPSGELVAGGEVVPADTPASMNIWCFDPSVMADFEERWDAFFAASGEDPKSESQLPTIVGELMADGRLSVNVVSSPEQWIGITNPEDFETAKAALANR